MTTREQFPQQAEAPAVARAVRVRIPSSTPSKPRAKLLFLAGTPRQRYSVRAQTALASDDFAKRSDDYRTIKTC